MPEPAESHGDRIGPAAARIVLEAVVITTVMAVLAAAAWWLLTPDVFAEATENGVRVSTAEARRAFGIEAWFAVVTGVAGVVSGAVLMARHRAEPVAAQAALAVTGVGGALLAWQLGRAIGPGDLAERASDAEPGTLLEMSLDVVSYAVFSIWPIAAVIAGAAIIAMRDRPGVPGGRGQL